MILPPIRKKMCLALCAVAGLIADRPMHGMEWRVTVAANGPANFKTIQAAVASVTNESRDRTIIHLKPGTYPGPLIVPKEKTNVTLEGEDAAKTLIAWDHNALEPAGPGMPHSNPGVYVVGNGFRAEKVTFQNTSGDHGQGLAIRVDADKGVFTSCRFLGWQDTLMLNKGRHYLWDCYVEGRVDFIYGDGAVVFDRCELHSKNGGMVTAASTPPERPFGFVFLDCVLTGDPSPWIDPTGVTPPRPQTSPPMAHLGRPWRPNASVTFVRCRMDGHIAPEGWDHWGNPANDATVRYAEYGSTGPGGRMDTRVPWAKQLTKTDADNITVETVLGGSDHWTPNR